MLCPHCARMNEDNARFCAFCGYTLQAPPVQPTYAPPVQPVQTQPAYTPPPTYQPAAVPGYGLPHPVIETVRSVATSPVFLVALICLTVSLVLGWFSTMDMTPVIEWYNEFMAEMGEVTTPDITGLSTGLSVGSVIGAIFGSIPSILVVVGLWMTYASAKKNQPLISTSGLNMVRVLQIIGLVGFCLLMGLVLLVWLLVCVFAWDEMSMSPDMAGFETFGAVLLVIFTLIIAAVIALYIVYYAKLIKTLGTVRDTLITGVPSDKVSVLVAVMCFISGGGAAVSLPVYLLIGYSPVTAVSLVASAAASILFGVVLLQYRTRMRQLMAAAPPACAAPAAPFVAAGQVYGTPYAGVPAPPAPPQEPAPDEQINNME